MFAPNPVAVLLHDVVIAFARSGDRQVRLPLSHASGFAATREVAKTDKRCKQLFTGDAVRHTIPFAMERYGRMDELAAGVLRALACTDPSASAPVRGGGRVSCKHL